MSEYRATIEWENKGEGFLTGKYSREHTWAFDGGMRVAASPSPLKVPVPYSNPAFVDPEEAFVASVSSCHMLTFIYLASQRGILIERYIDEAMGYMTPNEKGIPWFSLVVLNPKIIIGGAGSPSTGEIESLHHLAHEQCYIANSIKSEVRVIPA
ncbi:MAG: putative redox protein [Verrucomicrobiales bacterium]|nr:putative redox protein [Verrucomicrobiales bacterium]